MEPEIENNKHKIRNAVDVNFKPYLSLALVLLESIVSSFLI